MFVHSWRQNGYWTLLGLYTYTCIVVLNIAYIMRALDCALSNALLWLGTPEVILKLEQRSAIVKFAYGHLPTGFAKYVCFQMLVFVLIVLGMSGKYLAGSGVVVVVSPSSCHFFLMVDRVLDNVTGYVDHVTTWTLFAPPTYECMFRLWCMWNSENQALFLSLSWAWEQG